MILCLATAIALHSVFAWTSVLFGFQCCRLSLANTESTEPWVPKRCGKCLAPPNAQKFKVAAYIVNESESLRAACLSRGSP